MAHSKWFKSRSLKPPPTDWLERLKIASSYYKINTELGRRRAVGNVDDGKIKGSRWA